MPNCCCPERAVEENGRRCPQSGSVGSAIDRQTIKALLTEHALRRLMAAEYWFCSDASCDVVYFDSDGARFGVGDLRVPVWQKLPFGTRPLCYCFGESEASIRTEFEATGRSLVVERIREGIAADRCACELRNPRGTCCLGDVIAAVKRVKLAMAPSNATPSEGHLDVG
jgi:hypothetical protein